MNQPWTQAAPVWAIMIDTAGDGHATPARYGMGDFWGCLALFPSQAEAAASCDKFRAMLPKGRAWPYMLDSADLADNWGRICRSRAAKLADYLPT